MPFRTILVPYDGSASAEAMLRLACRAIGKQGQLVVLYVTRIPSSLPLDPLPLWIDNDGNAALDRAEEVAAAHGVAIETTLTRSRRAVDAIVGEARTQEVDAVFLPRISWRHPWRRLRVLAIARALARGVGCAVLLGSWREPGAPRTTRRGADALGSVTSTYTGLTSAYMTSPRDTGMTGATDRRAASR